ncbi:MAG TPA: hypothetical protein VGK29_08125 [Paludibaculum sp.]|jgi:hypothetical protein
MMVNLRQFEVTDPFGRVWQAEFRWQQNAISIRHCDAVDCKYYLTSGEEKREMVVALLHADLMAVASAEGRELTDPWCMGLAGLHLRHMIATWEDMEQAIAVVVPAALAQYASEIETLTRQERERAANAH